MTSEDPVDVSVVGWYTKIKVVVRGAVYRIVERIITWAYKLIPDKLQSILNNAQWLSENVTFGLKLPLD